MKRAENDYDDEDYEVKLERNAQSPPMTAEEIRKSEELYNVSQTNRVRVSTETFFYKLVFNIKSFRAIWRRQM